MADTVNLEDLLDSLDDAAKTELESTPAVEPWNGSLDVASLPIEARKWIKVPDVVTVAADLKGSTQLGTDKWARSTAGIYQAATGGAVNVLNKFQADFIQIQGDGAVGLFWDGDRYERAICAGITIKTFSTALAERLETRWPGGPETGFKVGMASSRILVKRIGTPRNPAEQEPVWAGRSVNYGVKAAQQADRHEMIVTGSVWDWVEENDYLAISCPCGNGPSLSIWDNCVIDHLPANDSKESQGRRLHVGWCKIHGAEYCDAVMSGRKKRDDVNHLRRALTQSQMQDAIRCKAREERASRRARLSGAAR